MRFEHGSLRTECLAAVALIVLLCCCCCCRPSVARRSSPFRRTFRQCLYLDEDVGPWDACGAQGRNVRLRFCDAYELDRLFRKGGAPCDKRALDHLREQDDKAREAACLFRQLIDRYDCENANSVSWTCKDCEEAYKQWVCAMFLPPLQVEGEGVKPCRYICRLVEQRCPYFHPSVKDQYAGERVFKCIAFQMVFAKPLAVQATLPAMRAAIAQRQNVGLELRRFHVGAPVLSLPCLDNEKGVCIDPDIPDLEGVLEVSSYGQPNRCYCPHHLAGSGTDNDPECRLLTPAQLRRNASIMRSGHRSGGAPGRPVPPLVLAVVVLVTWTWTTWTR